MLAAEELTDSKAAQPHRTSNYEAQIRGTCWHQKSSQYTAILSET